MISRRVAEVADVDHEVVEIFLAKDDAARLDVCDRDVWRWIVSANVESRELRVVSEFESRTRASSQTPEIGDHDDPFWTGRFDLAQQRLGAAQCLFVICSIPSCAQTFNGRSHSILIAVKRLTTV